MATRDDRSAHATLTMIAVLLVVCGVLGFEIIPGFLDAASSPARYQGLFFTGAFFLFLNLHHYAIDAAIWRMRDPHVRQILLS